MDDHQMERDDISNGYIRVVERKEHGSVLTMDLLESFSDGFHRPVLFRGMVPLDPKVQSRSFFEVEVGQKLLWRERTGNAPVTVRNKQGKTDYNYVSGKEGTAKEYLDDIFVNKKDVYAHLGNISSGFQDLHKFPWGGTLFDHVHQEVFAKPWFDVPGWRLTGHVFLGNNTDMYGDPANGAPGSDWHMFATTNLFLLLAGRKKWMTRPPRKGDQFRNLNELISPAGGRECPEDDVPFDTVYINPGDLLFNMPYEWHKVLNARGWNLGAAFRVIDETYVARILNMPAIKANLKTKRLNDDLAHLMTSLNTASHDPVRMQMSLNTAEMMICTMARLELLED
jgi:hypothetical protein